SKLGRMEESLPEKIEIGTVAVDHEEEWLKELTREDFESTENWLSQLKKRHLIEFYNHSLEKITKEEITTAIQFATEEQPVFNRQFNMLISDLQKRCGKQCTPYIFAENPKQLERLRSIFEDLKAEINFVPVPTSISKGFIDLEKNILCYTDHEIFQRYHKYKVKQAYSRGKAITLRALKELQPGDYVTHIDHGVGLYSGL